MHLTSDNKKALLMILGGILFVIIILKISPPKDSKIFEAEVLKFRNSNIDGKISSLRSSDRGNRVTVNGDDYWFAPKIGIAGSFNNVVLVGDSMIKKAHSDTLWIIKAKTGKKTFFTFAPWNDVQE